MRITMPTGAWLQNIEGFLKRVEEPDEPGLELVIPESFVAVHPLVLAMIAAAGLRAQDQGHPLEVPKLPDTRSVRYLARMGLFDLLGVDTGIEMAEHEAAGRFVTLRAITDGKTLSDFIVELVPLLHADKGQAEPVQYVVAELVRNTLEHAGASTRAVVMAQRFKRSGAIGIGVADTGRGVMSSLAPSHSTASDLEAVQLAMRPGVTGTTPRIGGTSENAGAGLFFCKSLAYISSQYFVVHSMNGMFKLRRRRASADDSLTIHARAEDDNATRHGDLPRWPGTAVGIDIGTGVLDSFADFMQFMRETYDLDVRVQKKSKNRARARFR